MELERDGIIFRVAIDAAKDSTDNSHKDESCGDADDNFESERGQKIRRGFFGWARGGGNLIEIGLIIHVI